MRLAYTTGAVSGHESSTLEHPGYMASMSSVEGSRWLADHIPTVPLVALDGQDHLPQVDSDEIMDVIEEFLARL